MAVLILLLTWLSPVLPAMNKLPSPVALNLTSNHFIHLLSWERGAGTPPGTWYNVSVISETGTSWLPVAGCQSVVDPLFCDLTKAFSDPFEMYLTQVTAHLGSETSSVVTKGFRPIRDTVLDPPLLSVALHGGNLSVKLKPPVEHLRDVYEHLKYKVNVSDKGNPLQNPPYSVSLDGLVLEDVAPARQYCVSVCISDTLENKHSHHSQPVCVVTPSSHKPEVLVWSLLSVLMLLGVSTLAFSVGAGFICLRKRNLPSTLTTLHHIEEANILAAPCASSFSPLYNEKSRTPPVREKRSSSTSSSECSDDEEESTPQSSGGGGGGGGLYLSKKGTNLPSSSSSSASSLISAPSVPVSTSSNLPSHSVTPPPLPPPLPPQDEDAAETTPLTEHKHTLNTHSDDRTPPSHTVCSPAGGGEEVGDGLNVNLLTLTFDREEEEVEEEEEEEEEKRPVFSSNMNPFLLPERADIGAVSCPEDEEEKEEEDEEEDDDDEEESSGYIRHAESCSFNLQSTSWRRMELRILLLLHLQLAGLCVPLPPPSSVSISSFNMQHTLSFLPGPQSPAHTRYAVQTLRRRRWKSVAACSALTAGQTCNLTTVFAEPINSYRARVQAYTSTQTSNWTESADFQPLTHSVFGPPGLSVSGCGNCLLLQITPPTTEGQQQQQQLKDLYRDLDFQVKRTRDGAQFEMTVPFREQVVISYLQTGVEYCVSVRVNVLFSTSLYSQPHCAFTSPPPTVHTEVFAVFSLMGALCCLCLLLIGLVIYRGGRGFKSGRLLSALSFLFTNKDVGSTRTDLHAQTSPTQIALS
ncbi:cytokine receptor family member b2 [Halichoeres trimaculatus]|uniref:cytokine receptor family member b2 n=1 Tax=Halichoeres trimaculatus TaxID=147232 RepID=UPI003D9F9BA6